MIIKKINVLLLLFLLYIESKFYYLFCVFGIPFAIDSNGSIFNIFEMKYIPGSIIFGIENLILVVLIMKFVNKKFKHKKSNPALEFQISTVFSLAIVFRIGYSASLKGSGWDLLDANRIQYHGAFFSLIILLVYFSYKGIKRYRKKLK